MNNHFWVYANILMYRFHLSLQYTSINILDFIMKTCQDCKATQIWLSIDDKPLQWHIPFCAQIVNDQEERKILVNYKKRPQNVIPMEMKLYQELKTRYFWTLKQASMITFKEKSQFQIFQKVSIEQQDKMFQNYSDVSLQMEFYEKFDNVWDLKVLQKEQSLNLALRIFYNDIYIQKGHKFEADETIGDLLINLFNDDKWLENITIYVHGLKLEKETKLRLLFLHLYSPDGFCYMLIVDN
ncbi:hypothetical protein pb186bvf_015880 [Paramecium bursaria]